MNLILWFLTGLFILIILAIVSNSGSTALENIERQIFFMNCPSPIYHGVATDLNFNGLSLNYTVDYGDSTQDFQNTFNGTMFICTTDPVTGNLQGSTIIKAYGDTLFSVIPVGYLGYIADWIVNAGQQIQAFAILMGYFVTPINFNVLGYTFSDLSGISVMLIIGLYAFCYIPIALFVYKAISPVVGVS